METIKRLEELVEEISSCYDTIPEDICNELNQLTGNDWKPEEYVEYCAEYWSSGSLEETVYALLHDGEYPNNEYKYIYIWQQNTCIDLSSKDIMRMLLSSQFDENKDKLVKLNTYRFTEWLIDYFSDWEIDKQNEKKITFFYTGEMEYGFFRGLNFVEKNEYLIRVGYTNLSDTEFNDIIEYIKTEGLSYHIG